MSEATEKVINLLVSPPLLYTSFNILWRNTLTKHLVFRFVCLRSISVRLLCEPEFFVTTHSRDVSVQKLDICEVENIFIEDK